MSETFRPRSNFVWAGTSLVLIILFAINSLMVIPNNSQIAFELLISLCLTATTYVIWIRPKLVLRDDSIEIVNPFKTELIRYADVLELETKWALHIIHSGGKTRVWVAPATGKRKWIAEKRFGFYGSTIPLSGSRGVELGSMSESLDSSSGQAAYMIRERIKKLH